MKLILYSTSACHLCELAEQYIELAIKQNITHFSITFDKVDIALDDKFMNKYGLVIPVIQRLDNLAELHWPFTEKEIQIMLIM